MNLANRITLARIFLVPIIMFFLLIRFDWGSITFAEVTITYSEIIATIIFIIAASTDGLDGYIARKKKLVTNLGKFLDPLADKLLITAALVSLVDRGSVEAWMAIVIISREFAVTGLRLVAAVDGQVIAASKLGKLKTIVQIVAICVVMLNNFPFGAVGIPFDLIAMWVAVIITIYSGIDYFMKNKKVMQFKRSVQK
jgi:CDP-diacylglycerol--glycerol-3-phosphate 3-phosphatidyltransferase